MRSDLPRKDVALRAAEGKALSANVVVRESRLACVYRITYADGLQDNSNSGAVFVARALQASLVTRDIVAVLRPDAIDSEVPQPFARDAIVCKNAAAMLVRALGFQQDDAFESQIFEIFDTASRISHGRKQRCPSASLRVQRIKRYIEHRVSEAVTLDEIAAVAGISPFVLIRQFKDATGMTPYAYLSCCRAREAQKLLRSTNSRIEEVGKHVGIHDQNYFARFFKRKTGITPSTYRQLIREALDAHGSAHEYCS